MVWPTYTWSGLETAICTQIQWFSKHLQLLHMFWRADIRLDHLSGWHWISMHVFLHIGFSTWTWARSSCCKVKANALLKLFWEKCKMWIILYLLCIFMEIFLKDSVPFSYFYSFIFSTDFGTKGRNYYLRGQCIYDGWWLKFSLDEFLRFQSSKLIHLIKN